MYICPSRTFVQLTFAYHSDLLAILKAKQIFSLPRENIKLRIQTYVRKNMKFKTFKTKKNKGKESSGTLSNVYTLFQIDN